MAIKILREVLIWSIVGFFSSFTITNILIGAVGQTKGILISLPLVMLLLGTASYKGVMSLKGLKEMRKHNYDTIIGIFISLIASLISFLVSLTFGYKLSGTGSFVAFIAGAIGGYLAERKLQSS